jgi:tRNA 2-selenouridine synthase SelU
MSERTPTEEVAVQLMAAVNNMTFNVDEFVAVVTNDHRTLQQTMGRVVFALIAQWADDYKEGRFDLRNEATLAACDEIMEKVDEDFFVVPYI